MHMKRRSIRFDVQTRKMQTKKDEQRQWLTSRDPSNLVTGVLKLGQNSGWERWVWWGKGMRMESKDCNARIKRYDVGGGAPCEKDDDAMQRGDALNRAVCCVSCYSWRALDLWCASNGVFTYHLNSYCLVCLSCVGFVLCCTVVLRADLDTWTPSISIRGPFKRAFSRRRKRKLGLALYA